MDVITTRNPLAWMESLEQAHQYDFYHLPQYHALAEESGEGAAHLFVHREAGHLIALPLLLRDVDRFPWLQEPRSDWHDATSVYGYAGPVASSSEIPASVIRNFQAALEDRLRAMRVVSVFSRLHPTLSQQPLLAGLGECETLASTVSIDLTQSVEQQRAAFRKNHKEGINKLRRNGVTCVRVPFEKGIDQFIAIYNETMRRVHATEMYFFPRSYFEKLAAGLGERFNLFVCMQDGRAICGGIFIETRGILQYHLGGTLTEALKLAPMKLLVDEVRLWATEQRVPLLHLGGGATAKPDDPLLHFKLGFSSRTHEFAVWRWVLCADVYERFCEAKSQWNEHHYLQKAISNYFPDYRTPTIPCPAPTSVCVGGNP